MSNSALPNLPGFGSIAESMELGRKMWGAAGWANMGTPGLSGPTLSTQDIDKQIADLKAVEAWLTLNMNMLRGTIQTLEVQSATLSALKSMGEAFQTMSKSSAGTSATACAASTAPAKGFSFPFSSPAPESNSSASAEPGNSSAASMSDPAAWWNLMQNQFKHALGTASSANASGATSETKPSEAQAPQPGNHAHEETRAEAKPAVKKGTKPAS